MLEIGPLCALTSACIPLSPLTGAPPPLAGASSLSVGEWSGHDVAGHADCVQCFCGRAGHDDHARFTFNGCSGSHTFSDLDVPTAPNVTCIPGPCSGTLISYRAFGYVNGSFGSGPITQVNGLFLPRNEARGQVAFLDYPGCGTATAVEWTATKR